MFLSEKDGIKKILDCTATIKQSCSNQRNMNFIMLIKVKMPTMVDILTFISMIYTTSESKKILYFLRYLCFYEYLIQQHMTKQEGFFLKPQLHIHDFGHGGATIHPNLSNPKTSA